jgi:hypothetical protein
MESRKPKRPSEIHIKPGAAGGYIARHSFDNFGAGESFQPSKEYPIANHKALMKHIDEHLGPDSGAYDGKPDVKGDADEPDKGDAHPTGTKRVPPKGSAPTARTHGAGAD